jgi:hypothetical protein
MVPARGYTLRRFLSDWEKGKGRPGATPDGLSRDCRLPACSGSVAIAIEQNDRHFAQSKGFRAVPKIEI